jgi:Lon protease-like protein
VSRYPDGRFEIVTVGSDRFELLAVDDTSRPYLLGEVQWLRAETAAGDEAERLALAVGVLFEEYLATAAATQGVQVPRPELPADPVAASYLVASAAVLALDDRQTLLEALNPAIRLRTELQLLKREMTMLRRLRALPVPVAELQVAQSLS